MLNVLPMAKQRKKKQKTKKEKTKKKDKTKIFPHQGSNPGPTDYQSSALPTELSHHK